MENPLEAFPSPSAFCGDNVALHYFLALYIRKQKLKAKAISPK